jgi:hypothetical protein
MKLKMEGTYPSFYIPSAHHQPMSLYAEHSPINLAKSDHFPLCVFSGFFPILCCYKSAHNPVFPLLASWYYDVNLPAGRCRVLGFA